MKVFNKNNKEKEHLIKNKWIRECVGLVGTCAVAAMCAFFISHFVGSLVRIDGHSMDPTLYNGEQILTSKVEYSNNDPKRFDIIVFNMFKKGSKEKPYYLVKRIIGLPGETVRIDSTGKIYINGEVLNEHYGAETIEDAGDAASEIILGENEYFVLGDNRNYSTDSRYSVVGKVNRNQFEGKMVCELPSFAKYFKK